MEEGSSVGVLQRERVTLSERLDRLPFGRFHRLLIGIVFLGIAFDNMDQITLSFVIPQYRAEWGISASLAALNPLFGIGGTLIGAIFWGWLGDRIGRKKAFIWTILIFSATSLINGFSWSFYQVVASCFIMGIGVGGAVPLAFSLISEYVPARVRGRTEVMVGIVAISGGYALAAGGAYLLLPLFGWRVLFLIGVLPAFLVAPVMWKLIPESPRWLLSKGKKEEAIRAVEKLEWQAGLVPPLRSSVVEVSTEVSSQSGVAQLFSRGYRRRTLMTWVFGLSWGFFNFGFLLWLPTLLGQAGYSAAEGALYAILMNAIAIPAAFLVAWLFESWSTKGTLVAFPFTAGAFMLLFGWLVGSGALSPLILVLVGGVIFLTGASLAGAFPPYATEIYPTGVRATGSGWAVGWSRVGGMMGPLVGGFLVGGGVSVFTHSLVFGLPLFVAAAVMLALGIETRKKRLEEISPPTGV